MSENPFDKIVDYLFIGSARALQTDDKFDMIVNCTKDSLIAFPDYCQNCIRIPVSDEPQEYNKFMELLSQTNVLERINNAVQNKENVLVHCFAGQQRSCALVACYLMKYYNLRPEEAINYIKSKRRIAFFGQINFISAIIHFFYYKK
jgi:dual specificity MAP kinase phosphatase